MENKLPRSSLGFALAREVSIEFPLSGSCQSVISLPKGRRTLCSQIFRQSSIPLTRLQHDIIAEKWTIWKVCRSLKDFFVIPHIGFRFAISFRPRCLQWITARLPYISKSFQLYHTGCSTERFVQCNWAPSREQSFGFGILLEYRLPKGQCTGSSICIWSFGESCIRVLHTLCTFEMQDASAGSPPCTHRSCWEVKGSQSQ